MYKLEIFVVFTLQHVSVVVFGHHQSHSTFLLFPLPLANVYIWRKVICTVYSVYIDLKHINIKMNKNLKTFIPILIFFYFKYG
jgi:hypothetical protein